MIFSNRKLCLFILFFSLNTIVFSQTETFDATPRGFGNVKVTCHVYGGEDKKSSCTTFDTEDAKYAGICASKRLSDLLSFGDIRKVQDSSFNGTLLELKNTGFWLLGVNGNEFHELFAPSKTALSQLAQEVNTTNWSPVSSNVHPRWLDCFDSAGPGVWVGGGGVQYTLPDDFEWLEKRGLSMCALSPTESRLVAPGTIDYSIYDWHSAVAKKYNIPYRILQFPALHEWAWNITPLPYVKPYGDYLAYPWMEHQKMGVTGCYEPVKQTDRYVRDYLKKLAIHLQDDPNFIGWHGCTEIPNAGINELMAIAEVPEINALWRGYLVNNLGFDLESVGRHHKGDSAYYKCWKM